MTAETRSAHVSPPAESGLCNPMQISEQSDDRIFGNILPQRDRAAPPATSGRDSIQHVLQRLHEAHKLRRRVFDEDHARESGVERGAVAAVGGRLQERVVLRGVVGEEEGDALELGEHLAGHVAGCEVLEQG